MALWYCLRCTAGYAVGLATCPQCSATQHEEEHEHMAKITSAGPSYEPGKDPGGPPADPEGVDAPADTAAADQADEQPAAGEASSAPAEPQNTSGEGDGHELPPAPPPHE